jgi:hypothetical protein
VTCENPEKAKKKGQRVAHWSAEFSETARRCAAAK